jgi:CelD/BcsL family acetyltransferase involved in cellulose biosynthesis
MSQQDGVTLNRQERKNGHRFIKYARSGWYCTVMRREANQDWATRIVHPRDLSQSDIAAWRAIQASVPTLQSPLLGPDFALAIGAVRRDARVAIAVDARTDPFAFFGFHHRPNGFARPLGAPFADYHALICRPDAALDLSDLVDAAGLSAFRLTGFIDHRAGEIARALPYQPAYRIRLSGTSADYLERLKQESANRYKNLRRYSGKLERALGPLMLNTSDRDVGAFTRLLDWKRRQLVRSGLANFLGPRWCQSLMRNLFTGEVPKDGPRETRFQGLMISLYAGGRHVAGHFGIRLGGHFHPWIGAMDPELDSLGAGFVHQWRAIEAMSDIGLHTYDLGPGEDHWKRMFTSTTVDVHMGLITSPGLGGRLAAASDAVWGQSPLNRSLLAKRLRNRLDHIATLELTLAGRTRGLFDAAVSLPRRNATRRTDVPAAPKP